MLGTFFKGFKTLKVKSWHCKFAYLCKLQLGVEVNTNRERERERESVLKAETVHLECVQNQDTRDKLFISRNSGENSSRGLTSYAKRRLQ